MAKRILYFADPMCSWCWGFSPVIDAIARLCGERARIRLVVGGLRTGETQPLDPARKASIRRHWEQVETATGQPFDYAWFGREGFVYDTEPACRAAVAARSLAPDQTLDYLRAVQRAFYAEDRDVTREEVLADVADAIGLRRDYFVTVYHAPEVVEATRADFGLASALGIAGFPTVVLQEGTSLTLLSGGYQPFDALEPALRNWLDTSDITQST
jgi:putative protein-disulfide isomerase